MKKLQIALISAFLCGSAYAAKTQYVTDQLRITLRTGQGNTYQILKTLNSGTRLKVLEESDSGYSNVRLENGTEGWVLTKYLKKEPVASIKLERAQKRLSRYKEQNAILKEKLNTLRTEKTSLDSERSDLLKKSESAQQELSRLNKIAARPILLDKENRSLQQQNVALDKELQILSQENQVLKDRSQREWFIAGAGVLICGLIMGLLIPRIRWKKKSSWS